MIAVAAGHPGVDPQAMADEHHAQQHFQPAVTTKCGGQCFTCKGVSQGASLESECTEASDVSDCNGSAVASGQVWLPSGKECEFIAGMVDAQEAEENEARLEAEEDAAHGWHPIR